MFDFSKKMNRSRLIYFARMVQEMSEQIGFRVSSRGWCYLLEQDGSISKDQFDKVEAWVNRCRREGYLPIDFVADESARKFEGVEIPACDTPVQDLDAWIRAAENAGHHYSVDWWKDEAYYIQMVVEKIDLVTLFKPVCQRFHIPIANSKGWSSMLQRAEYARRFKEAEDMGLECVLLYCGDHDPAGLQISNFLRKNLRDLSRVTWRDGFEGYNPMDLTIKRFGLNFDFIQEHNFSWINNLITGGGKNLADPNHAHHHMDYVQDYLATVGARKCEANVLVTQPRIARELCEEAIVDFLDDDAEDRFAMRRQDVHDYIQLFNSRTGVMDTLADARSKLTTEEGVMGDDIWQG